MKILVQLSLVIASLLSSATSFAGGCVLSDPKGARLTIEEYGDFVCPYCKRGAATMHELQKAYPGKIKLVFRNLPLPFHGPKAITAARALSAVCMQSSQLASSFEKELFDHQAELENQGEPFLYDTADHLGVNIAKMKKDMPSQAVTDGLAQDQKLAEALNFTGTPSFVIGTEKVTGALPFADLKKIVDKQMP